MNLQTPEKIRILQRKLYRKAKAEPTFRFYALYDKICREDILHHAYRLAHANAGAPGVDEVTFAQIEERGLEAWLAGLREELVSKTYRPDPVRRVMIPKNGGGERALGIPTIRDRTVQTAAKLVLEPIFEADFEDNAYGYRPARGAVDAVKEVHRHICRGYTDVVDADLSKYFDTIPHDDLLKSVARRVVDRHVLRLTCLTGSPPWLLTTAACGGLRSTPDCRTRRAYLHLSYSCASPFGPALLVTQGTKRTCRDRLLIVRFRCEADMRRQRMAYRSVAFDPSLPFDDQFVVVHKAAFLRRGGRV